MYDKKMKTTNNYKEIVVNDIPLIDVRAPIEFTKGAFPQAVNLPIMNDEERHVIGVRYMEQGNDAAVKLGHQLVSGSRRKERIDGWVDFFKEHPNAYIYCFRGGSRSQIAQDWISSALNREILRLEGGYKAFRNYLMEQLHPDNISLSPIRLGGYTGSGKTDLLQKINHGIDLEGLANHRGSAFGNRVDDQPTQISFENSLAYAVIKLQHKGYRHMILEDESRNIGKVNIPLEFFNYFSTSPLVILDSPIEARVQRSLDYYCIDAIKEHQAYYGEEEGLDLWINSLRGSLKRIQKRLGNDRYQVIHSLFEEAIEHQLSTNIMDHHVNWIEYLLKEYYDPLYQRQMDRQKDKVIFRGTEDDVLNFLQRLQ